MDLKFGPLTHLHKTRHLTPVLIWPPVWCVFYRPESKLNLKQLSYRLVWPISLKLCQNVKFGNFLTNLTIFLFLLNWFAKNQLDHMTRVYFTDQTTMCQFLVYKIQSGYVINFIFCKSIYSINISNCSNFEVGWTISSCKMADYWYFTDRSVKY